MRNTFIISIILLLFLGSCNKNKFNTVPSLKYKSVNTTHLQNFQTIQFTLSFTDKEGDLQDSITVIKESQTKCKAGNFSQKYPLPSFPTTHNQSGDLLVTLEYNDVGNKCTPKIDTSIFKFVLKDKAQHSSDTASSQPIYIQ